ncbi:hypothetical protein [Streptomyces qinglanensis]|uniref:hypothetical protein n=1 Tax=Streptomyces qinglanensis TaxID=943816 RepID=UPI00085C4DFB|nr:hypothetical protein [Streptomyces qinglanensis]
MAEPGSRAGSDESRSPWLRNGFVLAVAFIGFVAVVGVAVLVSSDAPESRSGAVSPAPGTDAGAGQPPSSAAADRGDCPEPEDTGRKVPTAPPEGVDWKLFHSVALPSSKAAGPAVVEKDVARCYAHTPLGALLATSQISVRYLAAEDWQDVTRAQTVGEGREPYLKARAASERTADPRAREGAAQGQIAGFDFVSYTASTAVIRTVWRFQDGRMQAAATTVLWRDGDWKLDYPADPPAPAPVDSLAGYVEWGGV